MNSLDSIMSNADYLGDPSQADWVSQGTPVAYNDEAVLLTMAQGTVGTLLTSTRYVWYGKVSATMTTSQGAGVVTAFILMSDVKDEIDFEFIGTDVQTAQSNYYFQGITDYTNEKNLTASNTETQAHTYTIDWQEDYVSWAVDGTILRTMFRNETYNSTTGQYHFPQSPARVQLSLWPAGSPSNGQGTIEWAGGEISWNSPYMQNGYYYAMIKDITVQCYDPPAGYQNHGDKAYYYSTTAGTNDTVVVGNNNTILASFYATGDDPKKDPNATKSKSAASATGSKTASSASQSATPDLQTIPGVSGAGSRGDTPSDSGSGSSSGSSGSSGSDSSSSGSSSGSDSSGSSGSGSTSFSQGSAPNTNTNDGAHLMVGSLVALVAFLAAAMMI
ncbi:hypothetical protein AAFC00_000496 [Neodothiora populina]